MPARLCVNPRAVLYLFLTCEKQKRINRFLFLTGSRKGLIAVGVIARQIFLEGGSAMPAAHAGGVYAVSSTSILWMEKHFLLWLEITFGGKLFNLYAGA